MFEYFSRNWNTDVIYLLLISLYCCVRVPEYGSALCLDLRILRMGGRLDLCGGTVTRGNIVATCLDLSVYCFGSFSPVGL
jgi:hypothetical protein